jgi:hypothetical protein
MENSNDIQVEMNSISSVIANVTKENLYNVPSDYFNNLPTLIQVKANKNNIYTLPNNYFETLSLKITEQIKLEDKTDNLPSIFSSISKQNVYEVPSDYFEKNSINKESKVVSIKKRSHFIWLKYAATACIVGIISVFVVNKTNNINTTKNEDVVINGTNVTYKQIQQMNVDAALDSLSTVEVNSYLCGNGLIACNDDKKEDEALQKSLDELNISDDDLLKALDDSN